MQIHELFMVGGYSPVNGLSVQKKAHGNAAATIYPYLTGGNIMNKFWMAITGVFVMVIGLAVSGACYNESTENEVSNGTISLGNQPEADFPALARLTPDQAVRKALAATYGNVLKTELEDENGFLVYTVEVVTPAKNIVEVTVDAGSGQILATEKDPNDQDGNREDNEAHESGD